MILSSPTLLSVPVGALVNKWRLLSAVAETSSRGANRQRQEEPGAGYVSSSSETPCSSPSTAGSASRLRPAVKAALLSGGFRAFARLKYLVLLNNGGGERADQPSSQHNGVMNKEDNVSTSRDAPLGHHRGFEDIAEEVVLTSEAMFAQRYLGYTAWLKSV